MSDKTLTNQWIPLKSNDIIDIVAPGYGCSRNTLDKASNWLKSCGFTPRIGEHILDDKADPFCANTASYRLLDLERALYATDSKAIWCLKGGYGTAELIPTLQSKPRSNFCKALIGFSDITALHIFLNQHWQWPTIHGPVLWQCVTDGVDEDSLDLLFNLLKGHSTAQNFILSPLNKTAQNTRENITAPITGGNMMVLQHTIGTGYAPNTSGCTLLLEEIDEHPYRIDRMLLHMQHSGLFDEVKAILIGDITARNITVDEEKITHLLHRFAQQIEIPVYRIPNVGHDKQNHPLPLGVSTTIKYTPTPTLTCTNGHHTT